MIIIGFFICIWYLAGGIALYHKIFTSGVEYFGYPWTVLIIGLTKFYTDEIFFWPKIEKCGNSCLGLQILLCTFSKVERGIATSISYNIGY